MFESIQKEIFVMSRASPTDIFSFLNITLELLLQASKQIICSHFGTYTSDFINIGHFLFENGSSIFVGREQTDAKRGKLSECLKNLQSRCEKCLGAGGYYSLASKTLSL